MAFELNKINIKYNQQSDNLNEVSISGLLEKFLYKDESTGYFVANFKILEIHSKSLDINYELKINKKIILIGNSEALIDNIKEGQEIKAQGKLSFNKKYESFQVDVESFLELVPSSKSAIQSLLSSGKISGIGISTARKIVQKFGKDTLNVFNNDINQLLEVDGVTVKKLDIIKNSWLEWSSSFEVLLELKKCGFSDTVAYKINSIFGKYSLEIIKNDPYKFVESSGISFAEVDQYAIKIGLPYNGFTRIAAYALYTLREVIESGSTSAPCETLIINIKSYLGVSTDEVLIVINNLIENKRIYKRTVGVNGGTIDVFVLDLYYGLEFSISKMLLSHNQKALNTYNFDSDDILDSNQNIAIKNILASGISVLTGGPGTGKTFTIKYILNSLILMGFKRSDIILCAPTGRAAKRMNEVTGYKSQTIHRLLGANKNEHISKTNSKLTCKFIIIDESSMIDLYLAYSLLKAIPSYCQILFVGDPNQLPSIGGGNFFKDLIDSHTISVNNLNIIHRQKSGSDIISVSHNILNNKPIDYDINSEFTFVEKKSNEEILEELISQYSALLVKGVDLGDIQVISPKNEGVLGIKNINLKILEIINEDRIKDQYNSVRNFARGEKVMYLKNNQELEIYNGDMGIVEEINPEDGEITVNFYDNIVHLTSSDLNNTTHSYAITIHKSQGSDFKYVLMPITKSHSFMLNKSLIYTAITRGRSKVIVIGDKDVFKSSLLIRNESNRITNLRDFLIYNHRKSWFIRENVSLF